LASFFLKVREFLRFEIFWELHPEFPGVDSGHQNHKLQPTKKGITNVITHILAIISSNFLDSTIWKILATSVSIICLIALNIQAAPIFVTDTDDSGAGSLRQALADANNGDAISFGVTGTATLSTGELVVDKSLTMNGPGSDNLIVGGNRPSRVFHVSSGVIVTLSDLTITNGASDIGGVRSATLTLNNCTVSGNSAVSV